MKLRVPAEWESHSGCITAWPHLENEWQHQLVASQIAILELVKLLAPDEPVTVLVKDEVTKSKVEEFLPAETKALVMPYGDIWLRDTGPIGLFANDKIEMRRFSFNGWGNRFLFEGDETLAERLSDKFEFSVKHCEINLEGGALDWNGAGTVLTTRQCALNTNRNPGKRETDIELALREHFGVEKVIWFAQGLLGDHTDGHIDNICRLSLIHI